ncbi:hypothetical protein DNU06_11325 [Putridiphycobacter roseus]|uniref:Lipoprotein n=1 Tax=Putridiphycobacter roseus TaxID=2219161 RepID=A0A2W1MZY1_9FLAO|nr:hypothetical protein [Putridiphycobacter roseus]PZE16840.1 hypothetical protein DNU06_11325 [Putridiphycobacter roseus]
MKSKKYYLFLIPCLVLFLSCGKKSQNREVISMEELLGEQKEIGKASSNKDTSQIVPETLPGKLAAELSPHYLIQAIDKPTFFDRFSFQQTVKSSLLSPKDSSWSANLFMYQFKDSAALYNAFNNWLDCFGTSCVEINLLENKSNVTEAALWCGIYDSSVVILRFTPETFPLKNELKSNVFNAMEKMPTYSFEVDDRKELKWR